MRHETVGGEVNFYAEELGFFRIWDQMGFGSPGDKRFYFDTQREVEARLDELVAGVAKTKEAKRLGRTKSVKVVSPHDKGEEP
jgi:hypothetical protein